MESHKIEFCKHTSETGSHPTYPEHSIMVMEPSQFHSRYISEKGELTQTTATLTRHHHSTTFQASLREARWDRNEAVEPPIEEGQNPTGRTCPHPNPEIDSKSRRSMGSPPHAAPIPYSPLPNKKKICHRSTSTTHFVRVVSAPTDSSLNASRSARGGDVPRRVWRIRRLLHEISYLPIPAPFGSMALPNAE